MSKRYTLLVQDAEPQTFARKDAAVRAGEKIGEPFQVLSPALAVVHEVPAEAPAEEPVVEAEPEVTVDEDEDLIGDVPAEEPEAEATTAEAEDVLEHEVPVARKPVDIEKMKAKISMMLAKAESTTFEAERDTFNAAAEKLMLRLGISIAELEASGERKEEEIVEVKRVFPGNYSISFIPFVYSVAKGYGHLTILQQNTAGLERIAYIIGAKSDVEQFCLMLDSLVLQVKSALRQWQKENIEQRRGLTDMQKYLQHRSFIEGFGNKVGSRLAERRTVEEETASTGAALVLASKESRNAAWVQEQYGEVGKARGGNRRHSSIGFQAGHRAGATANIGDKAVDGKKGNIEA